MGYDLKIHNRRSIRLKGYDYSLENYYFITICTQKYKYIFGEIIDGDMILNNIGEMIEFWWLELNQKFPNTLLDEYIIMPNHLHGIIYIINESNNKLNECTGGPPCPPKLPACGPERKKISLSKIIQWFKSITTNRYLKNIKKHNLPRQNKRLWHRNYYEHIIRHDNSLNRIREYIKSNPKIWHRDRNNPKRKKP